MSESKIFVAIPSYMDSELLPTIKDMLNNASDPDRLDVYVLNQGDSPVLKDVNVTEIFIPYRKSKGVCWALSMLQNCIDPVHKYYVQVDSHMRFGKGWDDDIINELEGLHKTVISAYPGEYDIKTGKLTEGVVCNFIGGYRSTGSATFGSRPVKDSYRSTIAGGFIAGPIEFILENPVDGYMNFDFQELEYTVRVVSNGWKIQAPKKAGICYHYYGKDNKLSLFNVDDTRGISQKDRMYAKVNGVECKSLFNSSAVSFGKVSPQEFEIQYETKLPQLKTQKFISIPVAVAIPHFKWQLELFWYRHKAVYGKDAKNRAHAIIIERNTPSDVIPEDFGWDLGIPFTVVKPYFDYKPEIAQYPLVQSNVQLGLEQILDRFSDEDVLELLDCDLFHMKRHPDLIVGDDEVYCDSVYEDWHLKSNGEHRNIIAPYITKDAEYNGGFVPIIAKVKTFKKIMKEWIAVNVDIVKRPIHSKYKWWSAMYALQAACAKASVKMIDFNHCYIHGITDVTDDQYICHYSVDGEYIHKNNKKHIFSKNNLEICLDSDMVYARQFGEWLEQSGYVHQEQ